MSRTPDVVAGRGGRDRGQPPRPLPAALVAARVTAIPHEPARGRGAQTARAATTFRKELLVPVRTLDLPITTDAEIFEDLTVAVTSDLELLQRSQASANLDEVVRRLLTGPDGHVDLARVARLLVATAAYAIEHWDDASHATVNPLLDPYRVGA